VSGDEVVHGQVEVQLLRWTVRPSRSHIAVGSLEGERDAGPITAQALPRVVAVIGDVLTQQACVELGEGTRIGAVEHDGVEAANRDAAAGAGGWVVVGARRFGGHAEQPIGPAPDAEVTVAAPPRAEVAIARTLAPPRAWNLASTHLVTCW